LKNESKNEEEKKKQRRLLKKQKTQNQKKDFASTHTEKEKGEKAGGRMKKEGSCWPTLRQPTTRWQGACSRRYYFHLLLPDAALSVSIYSATGKKRRRISFFFVVVPTGMGRGGGDIIVTDRRENPKDEGREILRRRSTISA
jgi:hypothetical protein